MATIRTTTGLDRLSFALRRDLIPSTVGGAALTAFLAGLLDASGRTEPLWAYLLGWVALTIAMLVIRQRSLRIRTLLWVLRQGRRVGLGRAADGGGQVLPTRQGLVLAGPDVRQAAVVDAVRLTSTPDPYYVGTFRALVDPAHPGRSPVVITPCNPRDISRPEHQLHPVVVSQWDGTPVTVSLGRWSPDVELIRQLPQADDENHAFASRDICYLAELGAELMAVGAPRQPLCMPEHCVDLDMLAHHDLVVLSGPDTNFWHAALYEAVADRYLQPPSSIPLALGLRDSTAHGTPIYGSSDMFAHLKDVAPATGWRGNADTARLSEALRPTYGMILATANPLADPADEHWCVFLAGLRSLGTQAATLCFTSMLRALRTDDQRDFWSLAPVTDMDGSYARVAAALVRADVVEAAAGPQGPRVERSLPHDCPDPDYRDSYVVKRADVLDTTGDAPVWRPVDLTEFAPTPSSPPPG